MKALKIIVCVVLGAFLFGCAKTIYQADSTIQTPQAQISLLNKRLNSYNVRIIHDMDSMFMFLPNKTFFNSNSANFTDEAYRALDLVAELTRSYEKSVISVVGFTEDSFADAISKTMAAERAHKVVQYLWKQEIDASFVYANGKSMHMIGSGKLDLNDYVVISFRKLEQF
jgi:outer membrane protein OmpA-like peptidoglycan-associated protein